MSHPRSSTIDILQSEFKDPKKRTQLCKISIDILKERPGSASRIFDSFPSLLPKEKTESLTKQFRKILAEIYPNCGSNGVSLQYKEDKKSISSWTKEIASIGIKEILDSNGHIKMQLIELLGWDDFKTQLGRSELTLSILCGYISAINQEIMKNSENEITQHKYAYLGLCDCLNKNIRQWVIDQLDSEGHVFKVSNQTKDDKPHTNPILRWPSENPRAGSLMVLAAITAVSSVMFFKTQIQKNTPVDAEEFKRNFS